MGRRLVEFFLPFHPLLIKSHYIVFFLHKSMSPHWGGRRGRSDTLHARAGLRCSLTGFWDHNLIPVRRADCFHVWKSRLTFEKKSRFFVSLGFRKISYCGKNLQVSKRKISYKICSSTLNCKWLLVVCE